MFNHKHFRVTASAALLAIAIASVPTGFVHAADHSTWQGCEGDGFYWDSTTRRCADKACTYGGHDYSNGDKIHLPATSSGPASDWYCDGYTGNWRPARTAEPQGPLNPRAPRPTTNGR